MICFVGGSKRNWPQILMGINSKSWGGKYQSWTRSIANGHYNKNKHPSNSVKRILIFVLKQKQRMIFAWFWKTNVAVWLFIFDFCYIYLQRDHFNNRQTQHVFCLLKSWFKKLGYVFDCKETVIIFGNQDILNVWKIVWTFKVLWWDS